MLLREDDSFLLKHT